jgi:hypothetical protein
VATKVKKRKRAKKANPLTGDRLAAWTGATATNGRPVLPHSVTFTIPPAIGEIAEKVIAAHDAVTALDDVLWRVLGISPLRRNGK